MKLRRKVLVLALAMSMMLAMPISGSADVGESSVQEVMNKEIQLEDGKVFYLKLSNLMFISILSEKHICCKLFLEFFEFF